MRNILRSFGALSLVAALEWDDNGSSSIGEMRMVGLA